MKDKQCPRGGGCAPRLTIAGHRDRGLSQAAESLKHPGTQAAGPNDPVAGPVGLLRAERDAAATWHAEDRRTAVTMISVSPAPMPTRKTAMVPALPRRQRPRPFPTGQAALKCLYLALTSLDPAGRGRQPWADRWKAAMHAFDIPPTAASAAGQRDASDNRGRSYTEDFTGPAGNSGCCSRARCERPRSRRGGPVRRARWGNSALSPRGHPA